MNAFAEHSLSSKEPSSSSPLLSVRGLSVSFDPPGGGALPEPTSGEAQGMAVDSVSFDLESGTTLCLVGESGCGKSVTALSLLRLVPEPPARILSGSVLLDGEDVLSLPSEALRLVRGTRVGMIFQDPMTSLNPVMRVGEQMVEGIRLHAKMSRKEARLAAAGMLAKVGIAENRVDDFPHQMSGGMRQRVMIGMALTGEPRLLIADEPTTALDVTVQKQILLLMRELVDDTGSALLLITHDLGVAAQIADEVAVMYAGRIVEKGPAADVLANPLHPYTQGLMRSLPGAATRGGRLNAIPGTVPGLWERPTGCAFHPRCSKAFDRCRAEAPTTGCGGAAHFVHCWLHGA